MAEATSRRRVSVRTRSTSWLRGTAMSGRCRSATPLTAGGCAGRSSGGPSKRSGTSSRRCTPSSTRGSVVARLHGPPGYTVRRAVDDWLREGLDGRSERTRALYTGLLQPVLETIGATPLRDLTAGDVRAALVELTSRYSTRSLQITRNSLDRAIQHAQANDLVARNVAAG